MVTGRPGCIRQLKGANSLDPFRLMATARSSSMARRQAEDGRAARRAIQKAAKKPAQITRASVVP